VFPIHELDEIGVTVIVEVIGAFVLFVAVNDGTEPEPELDKPMAVLEFVQVNVELAMSAVKDCIGTIADLQTVIFDGGDVIIGIFESTVTVIEVG
jgi:phage-related protein